MSLERCNLLWNHPVRRPEVKTLVGYKDWMDSIAQLIGCEAVLVVETLEVASLQSLLVRHSVDESSRARFQFSASCFRKGLTPVSIQHKTCNISGMEK